MKTELKYASHDTKILEIWWNGRMVGQVSGTDDGPGVRITSKYALDTMDVLENCATPVKIVEIRMG